MWNTWEAGDIYLNVGAYYASCGAVVGFGHFVLCGVRSELPGKLEVFQGGPPRLEDRAETPFNKAVLRRGLGCRCDEGGALGLQPVLEGCSLSIAGIVRTVPLEGGRQLVLQFFDLIQDVFCGGALVGGECATHEACGSIDDELEVLISPRVGRGDGSGRVCHYGVELQAWVLRSCWCGWEEARRALPRVQGTHPFGGVL